MRDRLFVGVVAAALAAGAAATVFVDMAPKQYAELKSPIAGMLAEEQVRHIYVGRGPEGAKEGCRAPMEELGMYVVCRIDADLDGPVVDDWVDIYVYDRADAASEALRVMNEKDGAKALTELEFEDIVSEAAPKPIGFKSLLLGWRIGGRREH